jgi:phenylalanyl-tRNA synthetase beta subunit
MVDGKNIGYVGEINPAVLQAWKLENPAAALQLNYQTLLDSKLKWQ